MKKTLINYNTEIIKEAQAYGYDLNIVHSEMDLYRLQYNRLNKKSPINASDDALKYAFDMQIQKMLEHYLMKPEVRK